MKTLQLSSFGAPADVVELAEVDPTDPGPGQLAESIEATYALADYREAIAHAAPSDRNGKVLFALR